MTPIPARASAQRAQSKPGRTTRRTASSQTIGTSFATLPAQQARGWQHDSPSYEAASSLSSLSLIISETPTAPPRVPRQTGRLEHLDEIDTVPQPSGKTQAAQQPSGKIQAIQMNFPETTAPPDPVSPRFDELDASRVALILSETTPPVPFSHIDEIDTVPQSDGASSRSLVPVRPESRKAAIDRASWTANSISTSSLTSRFITSRAPRLRRSQRFSPLDRTRWWLLRPGHIEFLLWILGSVLLFGITFLLLLATVLSVMLPGLPIRGNFPTSTVKASADNPATATPAIPSNPRLTMPGRTSLSPGAEFRLQGEGFRPRSRVVFLMDGRLPLLDQSGQAASTQSDASGRFAVNLWLGQGPSWPPGAHEILARETDNGRQVTLSITITSGSTTPIANSPGTQTQSTPAPPIRPTSTPVPAKPTATIHPTPTASPDKKPTPGTTPTVEPTPSPAGATPPAQGQSAGSSSLGNSLNSDGGDSLFARLAHLNPLVWVIGICYTCSMLLLGLAGILRRRRH